MNFKATKTKVGNRGVPPDEFLIELVHWGKQAPDEIFSPNDNPLDIYTIIKSELGPWVDLRHRRAAMMEAMRVHAGFEASWNWHEGVDTTNHSSMVHIEGQETGVFQVSFDSVYLDNRAMMPFVKTHGIDTPELFIPAMKSNHSLCMTYYGYLVRHNVKWAGPLINHFIVPFLSRESVQEFQSLVN